MQFFAEQTASSVYPGSEKASGGGRLIFLTLASLMFLSAPGWCFSSGEQGEAASPQELGRSHVVERIVPRWFQGSEEFWYRVRLEDGSFEFVLVDPVQGTKTLAFDSAVVNSFLAERSGERLERIERLARDDSGGEDGRGPLLLLSRIAVYRWDSATGTISIDPRKPNEIRDVGSGSIAAQQTGEETSILVENRTDGSIELVWIQGERNHRSYGSIEPGESKEQHTFGGHRWNIVGENGRVLRRVTASDNGLYVTVDSQEIAEEPPRRAPNREGSNPSPVSPDGRWEYRVRDGALWCIGLSGQEGIELEPAVSDVTYTSMVWTDKPQRLVVFRKEMVDKKSIHILRSSPSEGGRATVEAIPYALPGDPFPTYELRIYDPDTGTKLIPQVDRFEHEWNQPRVDILNEGASFCYEIIDRGHQRYRMVCVAAETGEVKNLVDERSDTFIWTAHTEPRNLPKVRWLGNKKEFLHTSEVNGWRQLFLMEVSSDGPDSKPIRRALTPEGIVLRGIELVDEETRTVWFTACGRNSENEDPYHIHYGKVDIDRGEITWLTEGNGTHALTYSPSRRFIVDTYSRVDMPPVTELRDATSGKLCLVLESTNEGAWREGGGVTEEVFVAKGRDGITDIWGIISRPSLMEPGRKYPVIEDIYAGPHGSFVPKNFSSSKRYQNLTDLGFIVVKIDGMGTANRSKAFQDVCWKNLRDGGFEDRVAWIRAAAEKYPELDLDRVGIYGVSAGGQNAAAAVLFHGDFYKVAVAGCGCHDNRMDKASWNEQWMGYPVGDHYARSSNIENAHRLKGKLLLIVGEVDTNVPPESTMRFADALIRHDKEFDLLVVPNEGHGIGGAYGERRMRQYFIEHLKPESITPR